MLVRGGKKIMGAVGSTFHFGGGLFIGLLYLVFGPGALLIYIWRVASNAYTVRVYGRARACCAGHFGACHGMSSSVSCRFCLMFLSRCAPATERATVRDASHAV